MRVFCVFFCFFRAKIWPAAAGTGELARDLRDQTRIRNCVAVNDAFFAAQYATDKNEKWLEMIQFKTLDGEEVRPEAHFRARAARLGHRARPMCAFGRAA
jgi:hypothetical protein